MRLRRGGVARQFARYKFGWKGSLTPLKEILADPPAVEGFTAAQLARNMAWLTWTDVFKVLPGAVLADRAAAI